MAKLLSNQWFFYQRNVYSVTGSFTIIYYVFKSSKQNQFFVIQCQVRPWYQLLRTNSSYTCGVQRNELKILKYLLFYLLLLVRAIQQDWSKNSCYCSSCYLYLGFVSRIIFYYGLDTLFIQHPNIFILEKLVRILGTGSFELHNSQVLISDPTIETKLLATKRDLLDRRYFYFVFIIWHSYCKICNLDTLFSIFSNIQYYIQS